MFGDVTDLQEPSTPPPPPMYYGGGMTARVRPTVKTKQ